MYIAFAVNQKSKQEDPNPNMAAIPSKNGRRSNCITELKLALGTVLFFYHSTFFLIFVGKLVVQCVAYTWLGYVWAWGEKGKIEAGNLCFFPGKLWFLFFCISLWCTLTWILSFTLNSLHLNHLLWSWSVKTKAAGLQIWWLRKRERWGEGKPGYSRFEKWHSQGLSISTFPFLKMCKG